MSGPSIEYDPGLLENAVRGALDGGVRGLTPTLRARVGFDARRRLDRAYALDFGEERERAFRETFRHLFEKLGLDGPVAAALEPFPCLAELDGILARQVPEREGVRAELWEHRERRGEGVPAYLVASIPPDRFRDPVSLERALLPWMQRAADLMRPGFGFRREARVLGSRAVDPAVRRVYESLWDLSARVRLGAAGRIEPPAVESEARSLAGKQAASALVAEVVTLCSRARPPTHDELLNVAGRLVAGDRLDDAAAAPPTGQDGPRRSTHRTTFERRCPLCRFPTCTWAGVDLLEAIAPVAAPDHPSWSPDQGACAHCAERYALLARTSVARDSSPMPPLPGGGGR